MADYLEMDLKDFREKYVRRDKAGLVLKGAAAKACCFWIERRCVIYPVRPAQCRTFARPADGRPGAVRSSVQMRLPSLQ